MLAANVGLLLLVSITIFIGILNYTPGTFLTGWDSLHPEFDILLNLKRVFFGVWRQEQGLGALVVHAHMSELPRILMLGLFSLILPLESLRYLSVFVPLIFGPPGVYFFLKLLIFKDENNLSKETSSFLGGLFYLLNLGTVQHFFVPFEMFVFFYSSLPWLLLLSTLYLIYGKKKFLVWHLVVTVLALPVSYAPTLWYAYLISVSLYYLGCVISFKSKNTLKKSLILLALTVLVNSFWLLPHFYQAFSQNRVAQAKINEMFSQNAFEHDTSYANFLDALLLKSFLFDWQKFERDGFGRLMEVWVNHTGNLFILFVGLVVSVLLLYGLVQSLRRKSVLRLPLVFFFAFSFVFLIHGVWPVFWLFSWVRENFELFREGYRFPWTKFSIMVIFCYSVFFSQAFYSLCRNIKNKLVKIYVLPIFLSLLLFVWVFPIFSGELISKSVRIKIPTQYFELYSWFKDQEPSTRIGVFPTASYWGWNYHKWGFQGAGFLWFGLPQSVLVRDFDRWSPNNENFYWEASYALDSENLLLFESVLEKYQVSWLIVDRSIINPSFPNYQNDEIDALFSSSVKLKKVWSLDFLDVYRVSLEVPIDKSVFSVQDLPQVYPVYSWDNLDEVYFDIGYYQSQSNLDYTRPFVYYPFRSLFTGKNQEDVEISIEESDKKFIFKSYLPSVYRGFKKTLVDIKVNEKGFAREEGLGPNISIKDGAIVVEVLKTDGYFAKSLNVAELENKDVEFNNSIQSCNNHKPQVKNQIILAQGKLFLRLWAKRVNNCSLVLNFSDLPHDLGYIISVEARNKKGRSPLIWVENSTLKKSDLEVYLPNKKDWDKYYLIMPPTKKDGLGYTIHIDNISVDQESVNDISQVTVNSLPYQFLKDLYIKTGSLVSTQSFSKLQVEHLNSSLYKVQGNLRGTLVLSQSFENGWKAYLINDKLQMLNDKWGLLAPIFGKEIKEHVLVNNWENGWVMNSDSVSDSDKSRKQVVIVFWPQYLEYLGFILAGGMIIYVIKFYKDEKN